MATLEADVTARIPADILIQVTNDDTGDTVIDAAKLTLAATDVKADFEVFANAIYDEDNAQHVSAAITGVFLRLLAFKQESEAMDRFERWQERLSEFLRMQAHNNRMLPKTNSNLTVRKEPNGTRPRFDMQTAFRDLIPDQYGDRFDVRYAAGP